MVNPYPIPRAERQTSVGFGHGGSTYGPFEFKVFDIEDVRVWTRAADEDAFYKVGAVVTKVDGLPFDFFTITLADPISPTTRYVVQGCRAVERSAGVLDGTRIAPTALEKEFSKIAVGLQELRRDVDGAVRVSFGSEPLTIDENLPDGHVLVRDGRRLSGLDASKIDAAQNFAADAEASAEAAAARAVEAAMYAAMVGAAVYDFSMDSDPDAPGYDWSL